VQNIKDFIIIKDNFFEEKVYKEILFDISRLKFQNKSTVDNGRDNKNDYQKIYFIVPLNQNHFAVEETQKNIEEILDAKINILESNYFLSTKHIEASPHFDASQINCLVYLKGLELMNSGTGFYKKEKDKFIPNLNVGFKENRAIIFDSKIHHASLQFNEGCASRYVMANFIDYEE